MDFDIGDIVKHLDHGKIGIVKLADGAAIWVRWSCGTLGYDTYVNLEILDKTAA